MNHYTPEETIYVECDEITLTKHEPAFYESLITRGYLYYSVINYKGNSTVVKRMNWSIVGQEAEDLEQENHSNLMKAFCSLCNIIDFRAARGFSIL